MLRDEWEFQFSAAKLLEGAKAKKKHHEDRLEFWKSAKEKVMAEVKDSGIEVSESMAGSNYTKGAYAPQVMVRADLQQKLTECHRKIDEHYGKAQTYQGWIEVLEANSNAALQLHSDDYLFFFGR
jgi:chromosome segregation ATPase